MAIFAKDKDELLSQSIEFLKTNTSITSQGTGSKFLTLLKIHNDQIYDAYLTFDSNILAGLLFGSEGKMLDYLAETFSIIRYQSQASSASQSAQIVKFYTNELNFGSINNSQNIVLPAGVQITGTVNGESIVYYLSEALTLTTSASEAYAAVNALGEGSSFNIPAGTLRYHNFSDYTDFSNKSLQVLNVSSIDNGTDRETDENLRYRIQNDAAFSAKANRDALEIAALSVSGVSDVKIFRSYFGIGTTMILVKATTPVPSADLLLEVQEAVSEAAASGEKVFAQAPESLQLSFVLKINYKREVSENERATIEKNVKSVISEYINNLDPGEPFFINTLAAQIIESDPLISSIGQPGRFFSKIYLSRTVLTSLTTVEYVKDIYPEETEKLIISIQADPIRFL